MTGVHAALIVIGGVVDRPAAGPLQSRARPAWRLTLSEATSPSGCMPELLRPRVAQDGEGGPT